MAHIHAADAWMAAIVVDESLLRGGLLADLATNAAAYRVAGGALTLDGTPVDLGYEPSATSAVERMRSDTDMVALFDMDGPRCAHGCNAGAGGYQRVGLASAARVGGRRKWQFGSAA